MVGLKLLNLLSFFLVFDSIQSLVFIRFGCQTINFFVTKQRLQHDCMVLQIIVYYYFSPRSNLWWKSKSAVSSSPSVLDISIDVIK